MIVLSRELADEIRRHAEREYPHECCGLLIGRIEDRTRIIVETYPIANEFDLTTMSRAFNQEVDAGVDEAPSGVVDEAPSFVEERHHRMLIPPLEYARAERLYSKRGFGVVGNYHSHPDDRAVPSQFDLEHLAPWPTMSYIVVSVRAGQAVDLRSWELAADRSRFDEEKLTQEES